VSKYEKHERGDELSCFDEGFYGSVTVGERGQIVIPADARAQLGISPGDKLLVMKHPMHKGLMVFKFEAIREFLEEFSSSVERIEKMDSEDEAR
jgi:AbrB family looped-hinge helix DNA binding protein